MRPTGQMNCRGGGTFTHLKGTKNHRSICISDIPSKSVRHTIDGGLTYPIALNRAEKTLARAH